MNRITHQHYAEVIAAALDCFPESVRRLVECEFLTGVDPVFAGLHRDTVSDDGRLYAAMGHAVYPYHQEHLPRARRAPTVALPVPATLLTVVHELGHILHWRLDFDHTAEPVSEYARTDQWEAFAEAATSWLLPGYAERPDGATIALLESL